MCSAALSSPIRARWELCVCYTYALVCGIQSLTVHLHVICNTYAFHLCVCVPSFQSLLRTSRLMCWLDCARWNQSLLCFNFTPVCASVMLRATRGGYVYTVTSHHHLYHHWYHTHCSKYHQLIISVHTMMLIEQKLARNHVNSWIHEWNSD